MINDVNDIDEEQRDGCRKQIESRIQDLVSSLL